MEEDNHTFVVVGVTETSMVILEAGCGSGHSFTAAKEKPLDYTGIKNGDPSKRRFVDISKYVKTD
jgi:hypothetical protein